MLGPAPGYRCLHRYLAGRGIEVALLGKANII